MSRRAIASPRVATAHVVNGKVVTRAKFPERTKLVLQVDTPAPIASIDESDSEAMGLALSSLRQGEGISLDKFRALLRRL